MNSEKAAAYDILSVFFGSLLYAVSMDFFLKPSGIAVGGITGIATVIYRLTGFPLGLAVIILNIPLIFLSIKALGVAFILKSAVGLTFCSLLIDIVPTYDLSAGDILIACFFGGAFMGTAIGIIFSRGFSTGGSDFAILLTKKRFPHISTGMIYFIIDTAVILGAAMAENNLRMLLYSALTVYISQKAINIVTSVGENSVVLYIISEKYKDVASLISSSIGRGITFFSGKGYYTGTEKNVLMCAMSKRQYYRLVSEIKSIDKNAFIIAAPAMRVLGEGFKHLDG